VTPPDWTTYPPDPLSSEVLTGTMRAMSEIVPFLAALKGASLPDALVKGGVIVAWGETDIYDPSSELHRRYEIGITSKGPYHSIDLLRTADARTDAAAVYADCQWMDGWDDTEIAPSIEGNTLDRVRQYMSRSSRSPFAV
jgi:hypothetical protein